MTANDCSETERLIEREAHGWSEAERLRVEQHLGGCSDCRAALAMSRFVRDTLRSTPRLGDAAMERAVARAVARTGAIERVGERKRRALLVGGVGALFAAAAALLVVFVGQRGGDVAQRPEAAPRSGAVAVAPPAEQPLAPRVEPTWIDVAQPEERTFAHARVRLDGGTRVRFDEENTTLALERGRVNVDVDVGKKRHFRVTTQHFRVEVLGTRFEVTPETVVVERGRVQVFGLSGEVLARELAAGASFSFTTTPEQQPLSRADKREARAALPARAHLARAREALAQGDTRRARESIERAEDSDPTRADRAEASTLRAEAALLDRDPRQAVRLYQSVAKRFPDLAAGENAAFAAAQLAARAQPGEQRALLRAYLERYPRGRFADEVRSRLERLEK